MIASALFVALLAAAPTAADPREALADAMAKELLRNREGLALHENKAPYFISYQLKDYDSRELQARYGALYVDDTRHDRRLTVDVRVGDYAFDNSTGEDADFSFSTRGASYPVRKNGPLDDSGDALRTSLWLITDEKYKQALFHFLKKKGEEIYAPDDPKRPPSFAREEPHVFVGPRAAFPWARERWATLARSVSARLAKAPGFLDSELRVSADKVTRIFVSSEGSKIVTEETLYAVHLQAWARADDGQLLENSRQFYAPTEAGLPTDAAVRAAAEQLVADLSALRAAPALDPYTGPAVLEPDAAGVLFHEAVGHRLEGERQSSDGEGKTFRGQVGKPVLPAFLSISDDPTLAARGGQPLNGFYRFDEEGVPAQRVSLVKDGVLANYLLSRRPVEGFARSNGHGRAQGNRKPIARMANLVVEASTAVPDAELKRLLVEEAKRQGKPFGLIIRDIAGGNTNTAGFGYQAFKGMPRLVYRVDVATGAETLVRGVEIVGTPLSAINRVLAAGKGEGVFNGYCGAESGMVPVSTVAPPVLLQEIELQRVVEGKDRAPLLSPPGLGR